MISFIKIENFRSCECVEFNLTKSLPVVGMNNVGKSNILRAIDWFISPKALVEKDYYNPSLPVVVTATFTNISTSLPVEECNHSKALKPYIKNDDLTIMCEHPLGQTTKSMSYKVLDTNGDWQDNPTGLSNALKALLMPQVIKIDAMDNCEEEVTKNKSTSAFGQLMKIVQKDISDAVKKDSRLQWAFRIYEQKFKESSDKRLPVFKRLGDELNEHVSEFWQNPQLSMSVPLLGLDDIVKNSTIKIGDNYAEFSSLGHGAQRSIQMGLLKDLASKKNEGTSLNTLLLIDEPELYLHPHAVELVRDALEELTENGFQVVFTTHSPSMVTAEKIADTLKVKMIDGKTKVSQSLNSAVQNIVTDAQAQSDILFSFYGNSQILFSEKVLLVEGHSEEALIPHLFKFDTGKTLAQLNIGLINMTSCDNLKKMAKILQACDIDYCSIVDLDYMKSIEDTALTPDLDKCKAELAEIPNVTLNGGWPQKGIISAPEAFSILAKNSDVQKAINNISIYMKRHNVWIWKCGDFEDLIGRKNLGGKKAKAEHAKLVTDIKTSGLSSVIENDVELKEMCLWLAPIEMRGYPLEENEKISA